MEGRLKKKVAQITEDPSEKTKARGATVRGLYKYWTNFITLSFLCFRADLTEETNILKKFIQTRNIDCHEFLRGIKEVVLSKRLRSQLT